MAKSIAQITCDKIKLQGRYRVFPNPSGGSSIKVNGIYLVIAESVEDSDKGKIYTFEDGSKLETRRRQRGAPPQVFVICDAIDDEANVIPDAGQIHFDEHGKEWRTCERVGCGLPVRNRRRSAKYCGDPECDRLRAQLRAFFVHKRRREAREAQTS